MGNIPNSFDVYGFTIKCNATQAAIYKWRSAVKALAIKTTTVCEEPLFSEIVVREDTKFPSSLNVPSQTILLCKRATEILLPSSYPVADLIAVIHSLEAQT